ncbi:MAG: glutamine amidotransferase [Thiotrichales bacterium]|nr:glutamine amidotransferase [Thiotrichales bacterium]
MKKSSTVVLVGHTPGERDDRVADWFARHGYQLDWRVPADGDELPTLDERVVATVVYGGVYDVHEKSHHQFLRDELSWIETCLKNEVPTLGLCLGGQLMADVLGVPTGKHPEARVEYGYYPLQRSDAGEAVFPADFHVLEAHWEGWYELPAGAVHLARSEHFPQQAFRYGKHAYAFQFHPEATTAMLERWVARRNPERSSRVGSHTPDQQIADSKRYGERVAGWLESFLSDWLGAESVRRAE